MINLKHIELKEYLATKIPDYTLIKKTLSIALGIALARRAPLPTSSVETPQDHYNVHVRMPITQAACEFNEQVIIDVDLVESIARAHYLIRYNHAYPTPIVALTWIEGTHFGAKLSGTAGLISKDVHDYCEAQSDLMILTINKILLILSSEANG